MEYGYIGLSTKIEKLIGKNRIEVRKQRNIGFLSNFFLLHQTQQITKYMFGYFL